MQDNECRDCPVKDIQKLHYVVEKKLIGKLPEDVREPLLEAKKQFRLALKGLIKHLEEGTACQEKQPEKVRSIKVD